MPYQYIHREAKSGKTLLTQKTVQKTEQEEEVSPIRVQAFLVNVSNLLASLVI